MSAHQWDRPRPFLLHREVSAEDADRLGHVNNATYLTWLEEASWQHIEPLGMSWAVHEETRKAMAIVRTEIDYLRSGWPGDRVVIGTWITGCDGRLSSDRGFQIIRESDGVTLVRATCRYVCIHLDSGKPSRMPGAFIEAHRLAMADHGIITHP